MNNITLITNKICPYARKANIALREKNNEFKVVEEDLQNKSEFFKETYSKAIGKNPAKDGLVPIIIDDGVIMS
jgi:glutathione S-transferase